MPITTTPRQIMEANAAIKALTTACLPVKAAYSVSKLATACQNEMESYSKQREKVFTEGGCTIIDTKVDGKTVKDENGNTKKEWSHPEGKEKLDPVIKQADELAETTVELNALRLDLELFGNAELPGYAFIGLGWAMKQEEPTA